MPPFDTVLPHSKTSALRRLGIPAADLPHDSSSNDWFFDARRSGDVIVEMSVHNLDACNWVVGSRPDRASVGEPSTIRRQNRDQLGYAWRVLSKGVCDGCALGVAGFHDWTMKGPHLCAVRLAGADRGAEARAYFLWERTLEGLVRSPWAETPIEARGRAR